MAERRGRLPQRSKAALAGQKFPAGNFIASEMAKTTRLCESRTLAAIRKEGSPSAALGGGTYRRHSQAALGRQKFPAGNFFSGRRLTCEIPTLDSFCPSQKFPAGNFVASEMAKTTRLRESRPLAAFWPSRSAGDKIQSYIDQILTLHL